MAGSTSNAAEGAIAEGHSTQDEVEALRTKYENDCKVINSVGAFSFVVTVQIHGVDLSIKFQIDETYPQNIPNIVLRSGQMAEADRQSLHEYILSETAELTGQPMLEAVLNLARVWLEDRQLDLSIKSPRNVDRRKQKSRSDRKTRVAKKSDDEDDTNAKKPPMKTAEEVISRVLWDDSLTSDCFTVGYMDRFLGIMEESFTALSWDDISSVDYNTLAIPKHRIQYFKYKDVKVWDKKIRMDNFFGSLGSGVTIMDVIAQWECDHPYVEKEEKTWDYSDDDEDDDGIVIHTGSQNQAPKTYDEGEDLAVKEPYWGAKIRPTHFLALRITNPAITAAVHEAHQVLIETEPAYEDCIIPTERLHVTLACLGLDTQQQIEEAVKALDAIKAELSANNPREIKLEFEDIGNFFDTTLYANLKENAKLHEFVDHLRACMAAAGVHLRDIFDFQPHMTLMKLSRQLARDSHNPYLDPRVYIQLDGTIFGSQIVDNIHLCAMGEERQSDGFYECPTSIHFA